MVEVLFARYDKPLDADIRERFLARLPAPVQESVARYKRWEDRQAVLLGKILLCEGLNRNGPGEGAIDKLRFNKYGRPGIGGGMDFNISHSEGIVVCCLSDQGRVGVDVERVRELDLKDFYPYLSVGERQYLAQTTDRYTRFFEVWTQKESAVKADGRGLSVDLKDVHTGEGGVFIEGAKWHLTRLDLAEGYVAHLSSNFPVAGVAVSEFNPSSGAVFRLPAGAGA